MTSTVGVHLDHDNGTRLVGTAYVTTRRSTTTTTFEYAESYLTWPESWFARVSRRSVTRD
jgi:hypothetical protein